MIGGKGWWKAGSSRNMQSYEGFSVLTREEDSSELGIVPGWREV